MINNERQQANGESQQAIYKGHTGIKQTRNNGCFMLVCPRKRPGFQMMSVRIVRENFFVFLRLVPSVSGRLSTGYW